MSTISFQDPITTTTTTLTAPTLRRRSRVQRQSLLLTADNTTDNQRRIEATTEPHRQRRNPTKNSHRNSYRSSIHLSIPPIQDRDSSLYSYQASPLPYYDWSKSCSDLTTRNIFPIRASTASNTSFKSQTNLDQSILESTSPSTSAIDHNNTVNWCQSTLDLSSITNHCHYRLDDQYNHEHGVNTYERHEFTRCPSPEFAPRYNNYHEPNSTYSTYPTPTDISAKKTKWTTRIGQLDLAKKLRINTRKSLAMSSSEITPTPSPAPLVPPRSALRKPSQTRLNSASTSQRPSLSERDSSLFVLEVGAPLVQTPSLSSGSELDEVEPRVASNMARRSIFENDGLNVFGKKRIGTDRDPLKIRDGLGPKESPSGVYTPPTFPGACGPRPAQYPTHVYTPTNFQLYPAPSSAGPSRSCSTSSSSEDLPQTPISPTLRMFSNKTMAGIRRISGSLASFDPRQSPTPTPASNRDSYFSYASTSSRQSSILVSPNSVNFPAGLGVGLAEKDGITASKVESSPMQRRPTEEIRIKRKPVPSAEVDEDAEGLAGGIKRVSIAHAL